MILGCISFGTIENSWIYLNESQIKYRSKEQAKIFKKFTLSAVTVTTIGRLPRPPRFQDLEVINVALFTPGGHVWSRDIKILPSMIERLLLMAK